METRAQDCIIIGGGPGGLAAAIYLSRFRLCCAVLDKGGSRASRIPLCRNYPGFPDGIAGTELLTRMRTQLARYHNAPLETEALALEAKADGISVRTAEAEYTCRTVLLATGMQDVKAPFDTELEHDEALRAGVLHYCPVCDGYEVSDKRVTVLGSGHHGVKEALFLRSFTDTVELVCPSGTHNMADEDRAKLGNAHVSIVDGPISGLRLEATALIYSICDRSFRAEAVYVAMGCKQQSSLAALMGAKVSDEGCIVVDAHQRTTVACLYAVGDVVVGLDQIVTAIGQAAIAATTIRNDLQCR